MRLLVPMLLLFSLLAVAQPSQAIICGPVDPVGDFVDCWYGMVTDAVDERVDDATDTVDCAMDYNPFVHGLNVLLACPGVL